MIQIKDKHNCCGCAACVQVCPKQCINFDEDSRGFRYPKVDITRCINCGLCEKTCPYLTQNSEGVRQKICAAINPKISERERSSSGGVFTLLAENTIKDNGVVFGAAFNSQWVVEHTYIDDIDNIRKFCGAKYTQSIIGSSYQQVKAFLEAGRNVLFSGTPCQILGLKLYLRKDYENLLSVEIACHGVPSPLVWRDYLRTVSCNNGDISSIAFRDKRNGWMKYGLSIKSHNKELLYEPAAENLFLQSFLQNLTIRPSCTNCPAKSGKSRADILIGDFWGVESLRPKFFDDRGCSLLIGYSGNGLKAIEKINIKTDEITYEEGYKYNPCLVHSTNESRYAEMFWNKYKKYGYAAIAKTFDIMHSNKFVRIGYLLLSKIKHEE